MFIRNAIVASLLGILGHTNAAWAANSCANVVSFGSNDESGLRESEFGIYAAGSFRIAGEADENKQPNFNLSTVNCENQTDDMGKATGLECKITKAVVWATADKPDTDNPNCSLDLDSSAYSMKELQKGILVGIEASTSACYNTTLTIDRNTKRVYQSFTRTKEADNYDRIRPGTCGVQPRTQVLMNCTGWARSRKGGGRRVTVTSAAPATRSRNRNTVRRARKSTASREAVEDRPTIDRPPRGELWDDQDDRGDESKTPVRSRSHRGSRGERRQWRATFDR
jgi:hypothetical protein